FRSHHRDLGRWPGVIHVGANVLGRHDAIRAAVSFARDDGHLGHGCFGEGEEQLRSVRDDAAELRCVPGRNPGTSSKVISGMLKQSQKRTKRAPLMLALMSSTPARNAGWLATMPTDFPFNRAKPITMFLA